MAKVKDKDMELGRLCIAAQRARFVLRRQREIRVAMVKDFAGPYWGPEWEGDWKTQPVNMMGLYANVVLRNLVSKHPKFTLATFNQEAKPTIAAMQDWLNKQIEKMNLVQTLKRAVLDGLFVMGIVKVALSTPSDSAVSGWKLKAGEPFAETIDFDDFVYDIHARDLRSPDFIGHRMRVPRETILRSKLYGKKPEEIEASEDRLFNIDGDTRISTLGRGMYGDSEPYEDYVDLWELYLPAHKVIVTVQDDFMLKAGSDDGKRFEKPGEYGAKALRVQKWVGPDCGPYHFYQLIQIPGNAMPKGPMQDYWDLHGAINRIMRKQIRQADRQKENTFVQGAADQDGNRVMKSNDGEIIRVDNPTAIETRSMGGPNQQNWVLGNDLIQRVSWLMGNLEVMGGLSPQGKTATQEKILNQNATGGLADMQDATVEFTSSIGNALCWFYHHHPTKEMKADYAPPGLPNMTVPRTIKPEERHAVPWEDIECMVQPYSLSSKTPAQRLQSINGMVQTILLPMMGLAQQQGVAFDMPGYLKLQAELQDEPALEDLIHLQEPPQEAPPGPQQPGQPSPQTTTHVRENRPGRTQQGDQLNLRNSLMGVNTGGSPNGQSNGAMK